jgi:hypothetical protein
MSTQSPLFLSLNFEAEDHVSVRRSLRILGVTEQGSTPGRRTYLDPKRLNLKVSKSSVTVKEVANGGRPFYKGY